MSVKPAKAALTISVDLQQDADTRGGDRLVEQLLAVFGDYQIPATWALADPASSEIADQILSADAWHEAAVLGDSTWVGRDAGRGRFCSELTGKISALRTKGFSATTLIARDAKLDSHFDLAVKQGITAVSCVRSGESSKPTRSAPVALRFGLWDIPTSCSLPSKSSWPLWSTRGNAKRLIDRAIAQRSVCHLTIDGQSLAANGSSALRNVERILGHIRRRCDQSLVSVQTMASVARMLTGGQQSVPARSILRPAA
jgi:hypothetical protein